jgi:hypothetical protein
MNYGIWFLFCVSPAPRQKQGGLGFGCLVNLWRLAEFFWQAETGGMLCWRAQTPLLHDGEGPESLPGDPELRSIEPR